MKIYIVSSQYNMTVDKYQIYDISAYVRSLHHQHSPKPEVL